MGQALYFTPFAKLAVGFKSFLFLPAVNLYSLAHSGLWGTIGVRQMVLNVKQETAWETAVKWVSFILRTMDSKQRTGKQISPFVDIFPSTGVGYRFGYLVNDVNLHSNAMNRRLAVPLAISSFFHPPQAPLNVPATPTCNPAISQLYRTKELQLSCQLWSQH